MMSSSRRRGELNAKQLHMDRQPTIARITDPSLPAGKRREIDNVMKKARANTTNDYWDKKILEIEEKDPNRWRHTGYKKMYIQGESSSPESVRETGSYRFNPDGRRGGGGINDAGPLPVRYGRSRSPNSRSRERERMRKSPISPSMRRRSPPSSRMDMDAHMRRAVSPRASIDRPSRGRPRSPPLRGGGMPPRSPPDMGRRGMGARPRTPPEPPMRRKSPRSPMSRRRSPMLNGAGMPAGASGRSRRSPPPGRRSSSLSKRNAILPRSKRPPSPPPRNCRSGSNSSMSSCSDDSCSVCSPKHGRQRSRSTSLVRVRTIGGPRSPPPKNGRPAAYRGRQASPPRAHGRPISPPHARGPPKYREEKTRRLTHERSIEPRIEVPKPMRAPPRHSPTDEPRLKSTRPPEPPVAVSSSTSAIPLKKKKKEKELRTRIKVEGEKRKKHVNETANASGSSSDSDDSGGSESDYSISRYTATTRLTLSERFGKMAQWSMDRSNMENMRITKDSAGGALKVMIEEGLESPPRRYAYSPAPVGHFPEELATTAPSGMMSWDDVRVRYEYYKSRGYLRDLDLNDYIKWEEWWYKYQEWLKQERYYEFWERQQMHRRRRKKLPISQRLN